MIATQNHQRLNIGFLFFAPQCGQAFAVFAISAPHDLQFIIFPFIIISHSKIFFMHTIFIIPTTPFLSI